MVNLFRLLLGAVWGVFRARRDLLLENLALRQQLAALKRRQPRSRLTVFDKTFWILAHRFWAGWKQALVLVSPETVVRWHRAGFRCYWSLISKVRNPVGRKPTSKEVRNLLCQMMAESPSWGAPRIHGELLMLGFDISERTVSR
jgi:putative transposase